MMRWTWACIVLLGTEAPAAQEARTKVFILAGQSNMVGRGTFADLPSELKSVPKNVAFFASNKPADFASFPQFGPEVSFAHEISKAFPKDTILIIKNASG